MKTHQMQMILTTTWKNETRYNSGMETLLITLYSLFAVSLLGIFCIYLVS